MVQSLTFYGTSCQPLQLPMLILDNTNIVKFSKQGTDISACIRGKNRMCLMRIERCVNIFMQIGSSWDLRWKAVWTDGTHTPTQWWHCALTISICPSEIAQMISLNDWRAKSNSLFIPTTSNIVSHQIQFFFGSAWCFVTGFGWGWLPGTWNMQHKMTLKYERPPKHYFVTAAFWLQSDATFSVSPFQVT